MFKLIIFVILIEKVRSQCEFCDVLSAFDDPDFDENTMSNRMYTGLMEFRDAMERNGYTEEACVRELNRDEVDGLAPQWLYNDIPFYNNPTPLQMLMYLFLSFNIEVGSGVPMERVEYVLGAKAVDALIELGVLVEIDNKYHSTVLLTPFDTDPSTTKHTNGYQGLYIATDFYPVSKPEWRELFEPVMALGIDTKGLAYGAPRTHKGRRVLDLCTGSGVQAILAFQYYADDVTLVDINPRAVRFSRFNLLLNGISTKQSRVYHGDLYSALGIQDREFDVILANPPYVAGQLGSLSLYGAGGLWGDKITMAVVQGARQWLTSDGVLRIVATTFNNHEYEAKLRQWWGQVDAEISFYNADQWDKEKIDRMSDKWGHIENGSNSLIWIQRRPKMKSTTFHQSKIHTYMWQQLDSRSIDKDLIQYLLAIEDTSKLLRDYSIFLQEDGAHHNVFKEVWGECGATFSPPQYYSNKPLQLRQLPAIERQQLLDCVFYHDKLSQEGKVEENCTAEL